MINIESAKTPVGTRSPTLSRVGHIDRHIELPGDTPDNASETAPGAARQGSGATKGEMGAGKKVHIAFWLVFESLRAGYRKGSRIPARRER